MPILYAFQNFALGVPDTFSLPFKPHAPQIDFNANEILLAGGYTLET